jgi:hypothetical protein
LQDIVWPGNVLKPPEGVPERRFLTITFLEVKNTGLLKGGCTLEFFIWFFSFNCLPSYEKPDSKLEIKLMNYYLLLLLLFIFNLFSTITILSCFNLKIILVNNFFRGASTICTNRNLNKKDA